MKFVTMLASMPTIEMASRFFLLGLFALAGMTPLAADTVTLTPIADTALFENNPSRGQSQVMTQSSSRGQSQVMTHQGVSPK